MTNRRIAGLIAALLLALGISFRSKPMPVPSPTATPVVSATPVPTMNPLPEPTPVSVCVLPPSNSASCLEKPQSPPNFVAVVQAAQRHAEENGFLQESGKVKDEKKYTDEVARLVRVDGFCAINGHEAGHTSNDETWVKDSNDFSEHFDLISGEGYPIFIFAARCRPAKFD